MAIATVIVHDPRPEEARDVARRLDAAGFRSVVAEGIEAVPTLVERERAEVVFLDAEAGRRATADLCARFRAGSETTQAGVIVALPASLDGIAEARAAGATEVIVKPLHPREVACRVAMVARLVEARRRSRHLGQRSQDRPKEA